MNDGNKNKDRLLGEPHGTASNRLKKMILFSLLVKAGTNICFQCGENIEKVEDLSIEHKEPWMIAKNPIQSFYDLDNIAFSHLLCNSKASNRKIPRLNNRGEKNGNSKLIGIQIEEIREKLRNGYTSIELAKEYNVSESTIFKIRSNLRWKYN